MGAPGSQAAGLGGLVSENLVTMLLRNKSHGTFIGLFIPCSRCQVLLEPRKLFTL
jgi:hypothetical protein